jgi:hypothetical protein
MLLLEPSNDAAGEANAPAGESNLGAIWSMKFYESCWYMKPVVQQGRTQLGWCNMVNGIIGSFWVSGLC